MNSINLANRSFGPLTSVLHICTINLMSLYIFYCKTQLIRRVQFLRIISHLTMITIFQNHKVEPPQNNRIVTSGLQIAYQLMSNVNAVTFCPQIAL